MYAFILHLPIRYTRATQATVVATEVPSIEQGDIKKVINRNDGTGSIG